MKNLISIHPASLTFGLAAVMLAGCATSRPPRQVGPPEEPIMPPQVQGIRQTELPTEVMIVEEPLLNIPAPQPAELVMPAAPVPAPAPQLKPRNGTSYTIRKGESLSAIAARNKMSWRELADYNYITDPNHVRAGQVILIPTRGVPAATAPRPVAPTPSKPAISSNGKTYVVQSGDSLSVVARRYGTSVKNLKAVNGLNSDRLLVGQVLKLPSESAAPAPQPAIEMSAPAPRPTAVPSRPMPSRPVPTPIPFVEPEVVAPVEMSEQNLTEVDPVDTKAFPIIVQDGDTLQSIADSYIVSVEDIRKLNKLPANAEVKAGQKLKIPSSSVY
ncbi:LysM peptidoglycan-binding domain-containing protein [Kiritimatiellaeota bacterium B1221]|nr:LysM peptidoglycan-binding domain-containing protein [Kiritimatiellaeota bacterium B1221]